MEDTRFDKLFRSSTLFLQYLHDEKNETEAQIDSLKKTFNRINEDIQRGSNLTSSSIHDELMRAQTKRSTIIDAINYFKLTHSANGEK